MFGKKQVATNVEKTYQNLKTALDVFCEEMAASDVDASTIAENVFKFTGIPLTTGQLIASHVCRLRCQQEAKGLRPRMPQGGVETRPAALVGVETR